jgi:diguanylate cyclase (GGDEF)-like protein
VLDQASALRLLDSSASGLTGAEAAQRLARHGPNTLPEAPRPGPLVRLARQFNNLLILVLIAAAVITLLLGHTIDTIVIMAVVLANTAIGYYQEGKAENALEALRGLYQRWYTPDRMQLVVRADGRARPSDEEQQLLAEAVSVAALAFGLHDYHETLRRAAYVDPLTGVGNRARLQHYVSEFAADAQHIAGVLYLDLDDFKSINDRFGHAVGDVVLEQAAARLSLGIRADDEVIRVGGDEFIVICREPAHPSDMLEIANDLIRRLYQPYIVNCRAADSAGDVFDHDSSDRNRSGGEVIEVPGTGASVGAAHADSISAGPDRLGRLITLADRSMYAAKRRRRPAANAEDASPDVRSPLSSSADRDADRHSDPRSGRWGDRR